MCSYQHECSVWKLIDSVNWFSYDSKFINFHVILTTHHWEEINAVWKHLNTWLLIQQILFYKVFTKQQHCLFAIHCHLAKHSMFQNPFIVLCNSSGSGHVTKSVNLIGRPAFFTVLLKIEQLAVKRNKNKLYWQYVSVYFDLNRQINSCSLNLKCLT